MRELHVGADSAEPASIGQAVSRQTTRAETRRTVDAQITQFIQVEQTGHVAPLVAVA
jgi:hypothetical protein